MPDINDGKLNSFRLDGGMWNIIDGATTYVVKNLTGSLSLRPGGYQPRIIEVGGEPQDAVRAGRRVPPSGTIEAYTDSEVFTANELMAILTTAPTAGLMKKVTYEFIQPDEAGASTGKKWTITEVILGADDVGEIRDGEPHGTISHSFRSTGTIAGDDWTAS